MSNKNSTVTTGRHAPIDYSVKLVVPSASKSFNAKMAEAAQRKEREVQVFMQINRFIKDNAGRYAVVGGDTFKMADWETVCKLSKEFYAKNADVWLLDEMRLAYAYQEAESLHVNPMHYWDEWMRDMQNKAEGLS